MFRMHVNLDNKALQQAAREEVAAEWKTDEDKLFSSDVEYYFPIWYN